MSPRRFAAAAVLLLAAILAPGTAAADSGPLIFLEPVNQRGLCVRHANYLGELSPCAGGGPVGDFFFKLVYAVGRDVTGAPGHYVSFESDNFPGWYLRHENHRIRLSPKPEPWSPAYRQFALDATFHPVSGIAPGGPTGSGMWVSYESFNLPGHYIRHANYHLYLSPYDSTGTAWDSTFTAWRADIDPTPTIPCDLCRP